MTAPLRRETRRGSCPDVRDEYRFYQVLIALWNDETADREGVAAPELVERLVAYMRKAAREAQLNSSWMRPDQDYESGLEEFVRRVMTCGEALEFRESVSSFVRLVSPASTCHSISQLILKCLMPGVPDFYQGCEDWTFTLTDPDNRRPVDFAAAAERLAHAYDPARVSTRNLKMRITNALLDFCADHRRILREAGYRPLRVRGTQAASVVAFERNGVRSRVIVAVPRLTTRSLEPDGWPAGEAFWGDTEIRLPRSNGSWTNPLTQEEMVVERPWCRMADLTGQGPWVVLARDEQSTSRFVS
jgi:(1->4)-alpha-D-glucan 1-alpha-D-glucosylmutase